ncbi:MAG: methyl-accepting chemotaxis protein [Oscillospiraceae bacterium]|jgi:methyl-accepting chemotaxis protein|nr:methyl-accepting chemotaxis protein [Oscillospiraceae bacterium]
MKNLKVSAKLFVSFIIVIIFSLVVGVVGILGMGQISARMNDMYVQQTLPMEDLTNSIEYVQRLRVQLRNAVLYTGDTERIARVKSDVLVREENLLEFMNNYGKTIYNTEALQLFNSTMDMLNKEFIPGLNVIIDRAAEGTDQLLLIDMMNDLSSVTDKVRDNTLELMEMKMEDADTANKAAASLYNGLLILIVIILAFVVFVSFVLAFYISGLISKPLLMLTAFMTKAGTTGELTLRPEDIEVINKSAQVKDEIGQTIGSCASFVKHVTNISIDLESIAGGDLTTSVERLSNVDVLGNGLQKMVDGLNEMFGEINSSSAHVSSGAKQVADSSQSLAQGSTEQAAAVEQLSSSISEIAQKTRENADKAERAANLANTIKNNAEKGTRQMDEMMGAVREINTASHSISKVIKVIDDIAFQTNILALNAAVEAARAGQHGKGFAVVAEEVRNLASKSAEAAKDTGSMIQDSMEKAELGARIAQETADSLADIVSGINESSQIVSEIAESSEEQSVGIEQINKGIDQVAQVVQQNSATAEESASASEEMSGQSAVLEELIARFKLIKNR